MAPVRGGARLRPGAPWQRRAPGCGPGCRAPPPAQPACTCARARLRFCLPSSTLPDPRRCASDLHVFVGMQEGNSIEQASVHGCRHVQRLSWDTKDSATGVPRQLTGPDRQTQPDMFHIVHSCDCGARGHSGPAALAPVRAAIGERGDEPGHAAVLARAQQLRQRGAAAVVRQHAQRLGHAVAQLREEARVLAAHRVCTCTRLGLSRAAMRAHAACTS